jgi:hypothetical protein
MFGAIRTDLLKELGMKKQQMKNVKQMKVSKYYFYMFFQHKERNAKQ